MKAHPLDNPIWASLHSRHADVARISGNVARYPPDIAPFIAGAAAATDAAAGLLTLAPERDTVFGLGPRPRLSDEWSLKSGILLAQMVCEQVLPVEPGPDILPLGDAHRDDVLALTALVYPHYFRPRTMALGHYIGIYVDGRLAAMAGERLATAEFQEISAVCTHPDFLGRGYARRLMAWLGNDILAQGRTPFLHVSYENSRAKQLYDRMGYRERITIEHWSLRQRPGAVSPGT